ncbi:MAG: MFS transporter [Gammaproteobacteria bacterium]|nr:MFS transporter [Gammaproteobacteria bacterium]
MKKNLLLLAICQALMLSSISMMMSSSALVGVEIAPSEQLITLPVALIYVGVMSMLIPASLLMQKYGRRLGFTIGASCGIMAGTLASFAVYHSSFITFCIASVLLGVANSFAQFYRFAAAEVATPQYKSRAISWVLAGGLVAAFIGPSVAKYTKDVFPGPSFSFSYLFIALFCIGVVIIQVFLRVPGASSSASGEESRPLIKIVRKPTFLTAVVCAMIAYGTMNLLMIATPLAMNHQHMDFADTATVIQWHIVGMFAPSFFTGNLIHRFGVLKIMFVGAIFLLVCGIVNLFGQSYWHFLIALIFLGIGWNFLFVGGTTLLTEVYRPEEKGKVQGLNDFLVFSAVSTTALGSGYLHFVFGWEKLNQITFPAIVFAAVIITALYVSRKRGRQESSRPT